MKKITLISALSLVLVLLVSGVYAGVKETDVVDGNVWKTEDGKKHFVCPVMGNEGVVTSKTTYSDVDGKRYYYCCAGCSDKFEAEPAKYIKKLAVPTNVIKSEKGDQYYKCPMSGKVNKVEKNTAYSDVKGNRTYFCGPGCKTKFDSQQKSCCADKKANASTEKPCCKSK